MQIQEGMACNILIKIKLEELKKYINKDKNVQYEITSTNIIHKCKCNLQSDEKSNSLIPVKKMKIKLMMIQNLLKLLFLQIQINHSDFIKQIQKTIIYTSLLTKWLLQKIREKTYTNDIKFLEDISKITINFEVQNPDLKNLCLCHKYSSIINPKKNNIQEKYIIFTTKFQINLLAKCTQILIDGTFKSCPRSYYQILNISGFFPDINGLIPKFIAPLTGKSEFLYNTIFEDIKKILIDINFNIKDLPNRIMIDFEKPLQKAVKKNFPNIIIDGCFFHFSKLLWTKAITLGLCTKTKLKKTKLFIFILKLDIKENFCENFEKYFSLNEDSYKKFLGYYNKNWLNSPYINYYSLSKEDYINRTNNYLEVFHHILNEELDCFHPKISCLISKYKIYLQKLYEKLKIVQ